MGNRKQDAVKQLAAVDLFCGVGGTTHGFLRAGVPVVAGVDIDPTVRYAYEHNNRPARFIEHDVAKLDPRELKACFPRGAVRVLIGCAPCQPFSTYSYRYRSARLSRRKRDGRWALLDAFARLVDCLRPEIVTAENVPELMRLKHPSYVRFVRTLEDAGYHVTAKIIRCADYGVPQTRERLVLLASRLGEIDLIPPTHDARSYVTVRKAIGKLKPIVAGGAPPSHDPLHRSCSLSALNLKRIRATPQGGGWQNWPRAMQLDCHRRQSGKTFPSVYGRMSWNDLAPTLTTQCYGLGNGRFGHPVQDRAISLREAALLQTFPPDYRFAAPDEPITFKHVGRHIGNAVPVSVGEAIAKSILAHVFVT